MTRPLTAAVIDAQGKARSLVARVEPPEEVTEEQLKEPKWLARLLQRMLRSVTRLERRPSPRRIDFEDVVVNGDGITTYSFAHGFGGRVRWWVVDCVGSDGGLRRSVATTEDVLSLLSGTSGTVTIRIEEVG